MTRLASPSLSVIMPTYNGERFIAAAIESAGSQFYDGMELVVVDDGSSDSTLEIVNRFSKRMPIRVLTPGRIGNWTAVSNIGMREASGEWACFLHQDDLWLPSRIAALRGEMDRADASLILHDAMFIDAEGRSLGRWECPLEGGLVQPDEFVEHLLVQNFIAICSPVFRRRAAVDSGGLDEKLWLSADWDLWLRLGSIGPVRYCQRMLSAFRVHAASQTSSHKIRGDEWEQQLITVFRRHVVVWPGRDLRRRGVERAALASIAVNSYLAGASRGASSDVLPVVIRLLGLGPWGWYRYLHDSRIVQRVWSRLKARYSARGV